LVCQQYFSMRPNNLPLQLSLVNIISLVLTLNSLTLTF